MDTDMTKCGPVHRLAGTDETPEGKPLTAIDVETEAGIWEETTDGVQTWAWLQRDGTWSWSAHRFADCPTTRYVPGIGSVEGHADTREDAIRLARAAAVLVGTEP